MLWPWALTVLLLAACHLSSQSWRYPISTFVGSVPKHPQSSLEVQVKATSGWTTLTSKTSAQAAVANIPMTSAAKVGNNHTSKSCTDCEADAPWGNVVLLVLSVRLDRLTLMDPYLDLFQRVILMHQQANFEELKPGLSYLNKSTMGRHTVLHCFRKREMYQNHCLAPVLQDLLNASNPYTRGVLVNHMDFWFHPQQLIDPKAVHQIWQLGPGLRRVNDQPPLLGPVCFDNQKTLRADYAWGWWFRSKDLGWEAAQRALHSFHGKLATLEVARLCYGWMDLFYVPQVAWADLLWLMPFFKDTIHEVALPTMFDFMLTYMNHSRRPLLQCAGDCCTSTQSPAVVRGNKCGHRIDLSVQQMRDVFIEILAAKA